MPESYPDGEKTLWEKESYPDGEKTLWEKGKNACYEQFLLFHSVFERLVKTRKKQGLFGKGLNIVNLDTLNSLPTYKISVETKLEAFK